jgi:hypothetical protein
MLDSSKIMTARLLLSVLGLSFLALVVVASLNANFLTSFGEVMADPWGLAAIFDLYVGFALFSTLLLLVDGAKPASFLWIILLFCIGNAVSVLWMVLRLPVLADRLQRP